MFVEDLIADFASRIMLSRSDDNLGHALRSDDWNRKFIESLNASVSARKALSTQQSIVFLRVVRRMFEGGFLSEEFNHGDIESLLMAPRHRKPPYPSSNIPREVRYLGENRLGFRCKRADDLVRDIKNLRNRGRDSAWKAYHEPVFNRQGRMWVVGVTEDTYEYIMKIIAEYDFDFDDAVVEYLALCDNSRGQPSTFVYDPESGKIVANVCDNGIIEGWTKYVMFGEVL